MNPINKLQCDGIKFDYLENSPRWANHAPRMLNKLAWAAQSSFMWKKSADITGQQLVGGSRGGDRGVAEQPLGSHHQIPFPAGCICLGDPALERGF